MNKNERNDSIYLSDIQEAIEKILEFTKGISYNTFNSNPLIKDAVIRNFEVIGEAANNCSNELKSSYSEIPWSEMYALRNRVSHEYFGIDYKIIWNIIKIFYPKI